MSGVVPVAVSYLYFTLNNGKWLANIGAVATGSLSNNTVTYTIYFYNT